MDEPITARLRGRFGTPFRHAAVVDSTNTQALEWAAEGAPEGALVVADEQTAGRGRQGRGWTGGSGTNLLFSLVLRPRLPAARLGLLTIAAGVGVARAVEGVVQREARLKWPNDVLISERKVAGILAEGTLAGREPGAVVAGIGLNTHWTLDEIPDELAEDATSIAIEMQGRPVPSRAEILALVLAELESAYDRIHQDPELVLDEARARSALLGEEVRVIWADGRTSVGRALAIGADGALEVDINGARRSVHAADVERIRVAG